MANYSAEQDGNFLGTCEDRSDVMRPEEGNDCASSRGRGARGRGRGGAFHGYRRDTAEEEKKKFDQLLPIALARINSTVDENALVKRWRIQFDLYSPRPFFTLIPNDRSTPSVFDMKNWQLDDLVKLVDIMQRAFFPKTALRLSFHVGRWCTNPNLINAHLITTNKEDFLRVFDAVNTKTDKELLAFKTRQWKTEKGESFDYRQAVLAYPVTNRWEEFFKEDRDKTLELRESDETLDDVNDCSNYKFKLVYGCNGLPVVSFIPQDQSQGRMDVLKRMIALAEIWGFRADEGRRSKSGGHICIHAFSVQQPANRNETEDDISCRNSFGSIRMDAHTFYSKVCPTEQRDQWYYKFCNVTLDDYKYLS